MYKTIDEGVETFKTEMKEYLYEKRMVWGKRDESANKRLEMWLVKLNGMAIALGLSKEESINIQIDIEKGL